MNRQEGLQIKFKDPHQGEMAIFLCKLLWYLNILYLRYTRAIFYGKISNAFWNGPRNKKKLNCSRLDQQFVLCIFCAGTA